MGARYVLAVLLLLSLQGVAAAQTGKATAVLVRSGGKIVQFVLEHRADLTVNVLAAVVYDAAKEAAGFGRPSSDCTLYNSKVLTCPETVNPGLFLPNAISREKLDPEVESGRKRIQELLKENRSSLAPILRGSPSIPPPSSVNPSLPALQAGSPAPPGSTAAMPSTPVSPMTNPANPAAPPPPLSLHELSRPWSAPGGLNAPTPAWMTPRLGQPAGILLGTGVKQGIRDFTLANYSGDKFAGLSYKHGLIWSRDTNFVSLDSGQKARILFPHLVGLCHADFRLGFADNSSVVWNNVDLCQAKAISIYYDRHRNKYVASIE